MHSFQNLAGIWLECGIVHGVKRAIRSLYHDSRYWGPGAPIPGLILFCIGSVGPTGPRSPMHSFQNLAGIWLECGIVHGVKRAIRSLYHDSRYWGPGAPIPGLILFCIGSVGPTGPRSPMHSFQNLAGIWLECGIVHGVKRAIRSLYHDSRYWGPGAPIPGLILFCIGSVGPTG